MEVFSGFSFFSGCLERRGVPKAVDLLFYCACLVGCVFLFCEVVVWSLFYSCCLCFVVEDVFWDCAYIYNNKV